MCLIYISSNLNVFGAPQIIDKATSNSSLTIAVNETSYPYHFLDAQGQADGLMADFWRLWASKQNVEVKFIPLPWRETLR